MLQYVVKIRKIIKKILGRQRVASTQIYSRRHSFGVSGGDLPIFSIPKFYKMPEINDQCATCAKQPLTAEQIINDFLFNEEVCEIKKSLTTLFFEWVQSEVDYAQQERSAIAYHYRMVVDLLTNIEAYQSQLKKASWES